MSEYSNELIIRCKHLFYQGFKAIYENTCNKCKSKHMLLREFQESLELINTWNTHIINTEYKRFQKNIKGILLDDLIKAAFINTADEMLLYTKKGIYN